MVLHVRKGAATGDLKQHRLDVGFGQGRPHDALDVLWRLVGAQNLYRSHAVPANGMQQVEGFSTWRLESTGDTQANRVAEYFYFTR